MITLVIGRRVRGKTTLGYAISLQKETRAIFDPRKRLHTTSDIISSPETLYDLLDQRSEVIVQPNDYIRQNFDRMTFEFFDWVEDNQAERAALMVDEARFLDLPNTEYPHMDKILKFTNPEMVDSIFTCHRPQDISTDIRALADYWCIFQTTQEHDLKVINERCGPQVVEIVKSLQGRDYLLWNDNDGTFVVKNDPIKWFVRLDSPVEVNI